MLVPNINAIHDIVPPLFIGGVSNRSLPPEEQIYFKTRGIGMADKEQLDRDRSAVSLTAEPKERAEKWDELNHALARKKFVSLHNYYTEGPDGQPRQVTDFDDFIQVAPPELVAWYFDVIQYGEKLSAAERRNFLLPAASPSGSASGEADKTGTAADAVPTLELNETATT